MEITNASVIKQKGESQNGGNKKTTTNFSTFLTFLTSGYAHLLSYQRPVGGH